ncbi:alpha/beta hydrolase [Pirellulaceae bacterium]|nr:alpha/beta hydrolase [Pirellulaceae bacterium]
MKVGSFFLGLNWLMIGLLAGADGASAQEPAKPQKVRKKESYDAAVPKATESEVRYGKHPRQVLDFWKAKSSQPAPLVFVIHGGGWRGGSKERVQRFVDVPRLLKAGISVVAINYRFTTDAKASQLEPPVKAPLYDAARALQYVRHHAEKWKIDEQRIGAAGGSAGACSSLWLTFHDDLADPDNKDPIARQSTRLRCAAVIGAQTTLDPRQMKDWTPNSRYGGHAFGLGGFAQFLSSRDKILPWISEYSPYALVNKGDPPVWLQYSQPPSLGENQKDPTHTSNFGVKLKERCLSVGVECELVYPGAKDSHYLNSSEYLIQKLRFQSAAAGN